VEVGADGAVWCRRPRHHVVDLVVRRAQQRLVDDAWDDDEAVLGEPAALVVGQHGSPPYDRPPRRHPGFPSRVPSGPSRPAS